MPFGRTLHIYGYVWMLALPLPHLGNKVYIDENALQPAQVNTYWNWGDVGHADNYLRELEELRDRNASSDERATYFMTEFLKLGIPAATQNYSFSTLTGLLNGSNAYAVFRSPRTSGTEAVVISASWTSMTGGHNLRGVSTILALSAFLRKYSHWSKDLIFVISDNYLDGMHAWASSYHGVTQSNLAAEPLTLSSGVIWTALNIDYPGHSFSHLGFFREGLNGRLPNQDLINSFGIISHFTGGVPIVMYDHREPTEYPGRQQTLAAIPSWVPKSFAERQDVLDYAYRARNILKHASHQARGTASGVHGLLHQFRIDAITLYAVPSNGPHGFHALGRVVESTLRTMGNLLERLHASFFFYIMTTPQKFLKIGMYLPSAILVGAALMFGGLGAWVQSGWIEVLDEDICVEGKTVVQPSPQKKWVRRSRGFLDVFVLSSCTYHLGVILFAVLRIPQFLSAQSTWTPALALVLGVLPLAVLALPGPPSSRAPTWIVLKAATLCLASAVISVTSVLNFSLAALLAVTLGVPLSVASPSPSVSSRVVKYSVYAVLAFGWLFLPEEVQQAMWQWNVLGVWFAPLVCQVYVPLMLTAGVVCLLPPS
ncbi:Gaa1-domain-containing protein [Amylostereum chailletii]|nr:Gaa1-domain-containing protein [Amylostereum chailletii]